MLPIKSIMTTQVIYVHPETPIFDALGLLTKHRISGLPVVDQDMRIKGILSEKDVLRILLDKKLDGKKLVEDYMTRDVICFSEDTRATDICKFFMKNYIRRVPVCKQGKLIGIVSRRDIVELILEAKSKISDFRYG